MPQPPDEEQQSRGKPVTRGIAATSVIPSAPADASPDEEDYQPVTVGQPEAQIPKPPTLVPTSKVWTNQRTGVQRTETAGPETTRNIVARNFGALKEYDDKLSRFNAQQMYAGQQQEKTAVNQTTREALKSSHIVTAVDPVTGLVAPVTDEEGKVQYKPGKSGPVTYDEQGHAIQTEYDVTGPKRVALDAKAKPTVYTTDPTRIYRDNKHSAPDYLGTLDEGLASSDPEIKQAAREGKLSLDQQLHSAAHDALGSDIYQSAEKLKAAKAISVAKDNDLKSLRSQAADLETKAKEKKPGRLFGTSNTPTNEAAAAIEKLKEVNGKIEALDSAGYGKTTEKGTLADTPEITDLRKTHAALTADRAAWNSTKPKNDGELDDILEARKARILESGGDPEQDRVIQSIEAKKKELGITAAETVQKSAEEEELRKDPMFGPLLGERDALQADHVKASDALSQLQAGYESRLAPMREEITAGHAQLEPLQKTADVYTKRLESLVGMPPAEPGEDPDVRRDEVSRRISAIDDPKLSARVQTVLNALEPALAQVRAGQADLAPLQDAHDQLASEAQQKLGEQQATFEADLGPRREALNEKMQSASNEREQQRWNSIIQQKNAIDAAFKPKDELPPVAPGDEPRTYSISPDGGITFKRGDLAGGMSRALEDGKLSKDWFAKNYQHAVDADKQYDEIMREVGKNPKLKALVESGIKSYISFQAGAAASAAVAPFDPELAAAGAPIGGWGAVALPALVHGIAFLGGTFLAHKGINALAKKLSDYSGLVRSMEASVQAEPGAAAVGEIAGMGPAAVASVAGFAKAADFIAERHGANAAAKFIATRLATGAGAGAIFEGVLRPAFDTAVHAARLDPEQVHFPTFKSVAQAALIGGILSGEGLGETFKRAANISSGAKPEAADLTKEAIAKAKRDGVSPEFRAFFGGIDPEIAGTTPEKVAAFAASLGMEWKAATAEPAEAPSTKPQAPGKAVEPAGGTPATTAATGRGGTPRQSEAATKSAHTEIDSLAVPNVTPGINLATQHALRGMIKIATGQPMESLTAVEKAAINAKTDDGMGRVEMVKGPDGKAVPVITQAALNRVAQVAPAVRAMLPESEDKQRQSILQPTAATASTESNNTSKEQPQGGATVSDSQGAVKPGEFAKPGYTAVEPKKAEFSVEVERPGGKVETVKVSALDAADAHAEVAGTLQGGAMVRDVVQTSTSKPADIAEQAVQQISTEAGRPLQPAEEKAVRALAVKFSPAVARWQAAFSGLTVTARSYGSMGGALDRENRLHLSLPDIVKHALELGTAEAPDVMVRHEAIHAVTQELTHQGKIDPVGLYRSLPAAVRGYVEGSYEPDMAVSARSEHNDAHEFVRMMVEHRLGVQDGKLVNSDGVVITEDLSPNFIAKIRDMLMKLLAVFRDLANQLRKHGASAEVIVELEKTRDLVIERLKQVDAEKRGASIEKPRTGAGNEIVGTKGPSIAEPAATGKVEPSGSASQVKSDSRTGSVTETGKAAAVAPGAEPGNELTNEAKAEQQVPEREPSSGAGADSGETIGRVADQGAPVVSSGLSESTETSAQSAKRRVDEAREISAARKALLSLGGIRKPYFKIQEAVAAAELAKIPVTADQLVRHVLTGKFDEPATPEQIQPAGSAGAAEVAPVSANEPGAERSVSVGTVPVVGGSESGRGVTAGNELTNETGRTDITGRAETPSAETKADLRANLGLPEGAIGDTARVTQNGRTVEVAFVAQPSAQAKPSHDSLSNPTKGYDQSLQPRDRSLAQYRKQSQNIAQSLDFSKSAFFPDTTTPATTADLGAPIMTQTGDTVIGNGREIGILQAYQSGSPQARKYKAEFVRNAEKFGIDPAAVMKMAQPILKRVILSGVPKEELIRFSQESNEGQAMQSNASEIAGRDASRLTPQLLSLFDPNFAIDSSRNITFLRAYARDVIKSGEVNEANLNPSELARRVRAAVFTYAYGADETGRAALQRLAGDEADSGGKTITNGLLTVAPIVARMKTDIRSGDLHNLDISSAISRAVQDISEALKNRPAKQSADVALRGLVDQQEMSGFAPSFEGQKVDIAVRNFLVENRNKRAAIEDALSNYVEAVYALGNPNQGELLARETPNPLELWKQATSPEALAPKTEERALAAQSLAEPQKTPSERFQEALPVAMRIANDFRNIPGIELKDVQQHARLALLRAAREYDPSRGANMGTFASKVVSNELRSLYGKMGRTAGRESVTLDEPVDASEGAITSRKDQIEAPDNTSKTVERTESFRVLNEAIGELPDRMKQAMMSILAGESTLEEIGTSLGGISRQAVARLATEGMRRLRGKLGEMGVTSTDDLLRTQKLVYEGKNDKEYDKSSTQVTLPEAEAKPFVDFAKSIPKNELYVDPKDPTFGRETEPHVTALYGITQADPKTTANVVLQNAPSTITATVGKLSIFKTDKYDVVKADITSPDLIALNKALRESVPFESDFPDYHPHLTIAYLKHGEGNKYVGDKRFEGTQLSFSKLDFRGKDGKMFTVDLAKGDQSAALLNSVEDLIKAQSTDDPIDQLMGLLDHGTITDLVEKAKGEEPGKRTVGRPDLALGASGPEMMGIHQAHTETQAAQTFEQWEKGSDRILNERGDYQFANDVVERWMSGGRLSPEEVRSAIRVITAKQGQPKTPEQQKAFDAFGYAYTKIGEGAARELAARRDPFKSRIERNREFLSNAISKLPAAIDKSITDEADPRRKVELIEKLVANRRDKINAALPVLFGKGVTVDDILGGETELKLKAAPIVTNIVGTFEAKEQQALKLIQGGERSFAQVGKMVGLGEGEIRKIADAAFQKFYEKHGAKFRQGLKAEAIETGTLLAQETGLKAQDISEADAMAEARKAWAMAGFVEAAKQGRMKVVQRKLFRPPPVPYSGPVPSDEAVPFEERQQNKLVFKPGDEMKNVNPKPGDQVATPTGKILGQIGLPLYQELMVHRGADLDNINDIVKIGRVIQAAQGNAWDMAYELWINNILSGVATHAANITGNIANSALDFSLQRGMEALVNLAYRDSKSAQFGEFKWIVKGIMPGFARAIDQATRSWAAEADFFKHDVLDEQVEMFEQFDKGGGQRPSIPGKIGRVIRMPGRALLAEDAMFKGLLGTMEVAAQAFRIAKAEGLTGEKLSTRVHILMGTKNSLAWQRAVEKTTINLFQEESSVGQIFGKLKSEKDNPKMGVRVLARTFAYFFPFNNTPANIFKIGIRKSPLGSVAMIARFLHAGFYKIKDGTPIANNYPPEMQVRHVAEQLLAMIGVLAMGVFWGLVEGDEDDENKSFLITGSMPFTQYKKGLRNLQDRDAGGTYQIRIGGRNGIYVNYGRTEPFATTIGTVADMLKTVKMMKHGATKNEALDALAGYFLAQSQSKTWLNGFANLSKVAADYDTASEFLRKGMLQALVPNLIRQPLRSLDPYVRDSKSAGNLYQALAAGSLAEPKIDVYGNKVEKGGNAISRLFFAVGVKPAEHLQKADQLLLNWNRHNPQETYGPVLPAATYKGPDGKNVQMTGEQARKFYEKSGQLAARSLLGRISQHQIDRPKAEDVKMIRNAFEQAHEQAKREMFPQRGIGAAATKKRTTNVVRDWLSRAA